MIKVIYNNNSVDVRDINTYLRMDNYYDESVDVRDINTYLRMDNYYDESIDVKDINTYLRMEIDYNDINYIYQTYDQFHPEYKRIIDLFNFGLGM